MSGGGGSAMGAGAVRHVRVKAASGRPQQIGRAQLEGALQSRLFAAVSEVVRQAVPPPEDAGAVSDSGRAARSEATPASSVLSPQRVLPVAADLTARDRCVLLLVSRGHSPAEAERVFAALGVGGTVRMPLGPTFWSPAFGMVHDRFGVLWMVNVMPAG